MNNLIQYILVDWSRPPAHERLSPKPILMTKEEAHSLNQALATNGQTKRYIKSNT
tara:strand:+ start:686 stop:850 length:165 start_codon:yes stop_codon:yes gene_type:complete